MKTIKQHGKDIKKLEQVLNIFTEELEKVTPCTTM